MIDISHKAETLREAKAEARIRIAPSTAEAVKAGTVPKGNVLVTAKTAGIMAAKRTADIIPLCHPLPLDFVDVRFEANNKEIIVVSEVRSVWKTGVEMEALTAVSVAALTVYDMLKPLDKEMMIERVVLLEKRGGKRDFEDNFPRSLRAGVLVISDSTFRGEREDKSGIIIRERLKEYPVTVEEYKILPDDKGLISMEIMRLSDEEKLDFVLTTGGTGLGPKDVTPEATQQVVERTVPGVTEVMRRYGQKRTPYAMLSRNLAGVRGKTLIVNLPGSSKGAAESMDSLFPGILHGLKMLWGGGHNHSAEKRENV